jgi:hypothetical protein
MAMTSMLSIWALVGMEENTITNDVPQSLDENDDTDAEIEEDFEMRSDEGEADSPME